jgi:U3 small nucleolar RNA-associated protein MPP10
MSSLVEPSADTSSLEHLLSSIDGSPDIFLQPSTSLQAASLVAAKRILDPVVSEYSVFRELALKGLDVEQIWEQIRLVGDQVKSVLEKQGHLESDYAAKKDNGVKSDAHSDEDDSPVEDDSDLENGTAEIEEDDKDEGFEDMEEEDEEDSEGEDDDMENDEFPTNPELDEESDEDEDAAKTAMQKPFKKDVHGLNDQFFSIDDFNRLSEQQDFPQPDDENADEIDYFASMSQYLLY